MDGHQHVHHRLVAHGMQYAVQAMEKRSDRDVESLLDYLNIASQHCSAMQHIRPHHPASLQAHTQLQLLCLDFAIYSEEPGVSKDYDPDPM